MIKPPRNKKPRPVDPTLKKVLTHIRPYSPREIASASGGAIGASTIANWRAGKVRSPLNYTLDAALAAAGFKRIIVED